MDTKTPKPKSNTNANVQHVFNQTHKPPKQRSSVSDKQTINKVIGETLGRLHRISALTSVCIWKKVNIVSATMCNVLTLA